MHEYLFKGICLRSEELFAGIALGKLQREDHLQECVVQKKKLIHTSPTEGIFSKTPVPPLWKFQLSFIYPIIFGGLKDPPNPQEFPIPSAWAGGEWIFS